MNTGSSRGIERDSSSSSSSLTSPATNMKAVIARYNADARILADYEESGVSGKSFDYSRSVPNNPAESVPEDKMTAYLSRIQRGGLVQPFGCMLTIEEPSFRIIGYSENSSEMLGLKGESDSKQFVTLIGVDATTLFTPASGASLAKALASREISLLNPIWVYSRTTQKPFYAIMHRIDVGTVIDLEPAKSSDHALSLAGAVQSQKLALRAISRLQSLPGGDIGALCDTVVEEVQKLTGYDRVMVYKFHKDDHGEVISEIRRSDLEESYLGLHYPATDIPQAARFLFKQNRIRMICDCHAKPVKVIQSEELIQPLCLVNSTLRAPHGCHSQYMSNMGSIASLVMSLVVNNGNYDNNDATNFKLWGLLVCHHTSPRYVPFPLRNACEFLMQAFGLQLYMEMQLASQMEEKRMLRTQTLLCDMLLRDALFGIVTQSPSIMDLVKCDGAALYYGGNCWLLGTTPNESQVKDIAEWLLRNHGDSTGLSTDSLADAGYPGASSLGDAVCGMAMARINTRDFLFWFRSHTGKEIKWGGAKHHPEDKDDGGKMNPRMSFKAFLQVVKSNSLPWEVSEINAIHSLQLIMRDSFSSAIEKRDDIEMDGNNNGKNELSSVAFEMVRLIETATVPVLGVDSAGQINGWNAKIAELTGLNSSEAMGKSLVNEVVIEDSRGSIENILRRALQGQEDKNVELKLKHFGLHQQKSVVYIVANACTSRDHKNTVVGVCFVGQDITNEKSVLDKFIKLEGDYKAIIQSLSPLIPPIFASDENACCSEWNAAMERVTGWKKDEVIGKMLPGEIFGDLCRLKGQQTLTKVMILLYRGISGQDSEKFPFGFFNREGELVEVFLTASKRIDAGGNLIGCFCFLQIVSPDLKNISEEQKPQCKGKFSELKELDYILQELKNPLNGIRFTHKLLENTAVSENQKQFLDTSDACERQIMAIIEETDLGSIDDGTLKLKMEEFLLGNILDAIVSQVMILIRGRNLQLLHEIPDEIKTLTLFSDQIRLQMVLSDFLLNLVNHTTSPNGWVEIKISPGLKIIQDGNEFIHLQFRMTHSGQGLPSEVLHDMFEGGNQWTTQEGLGLHMSRKILSRMNGRVHYVREHNKCYFLIDIQLRTRKERERILLKAETSMLT